MTANRKRILGFILIAMGLVLCCVGAWNLLSAPVYQAVARIRPPVPNSPFLAEQGSVEPDFFHDFFQTEFELLQSELVLGKAVEMLDLKAMLGGKYTGGNPLTVTKAIRRLRAGMSLRRVQNTILVDVRFTSEDPNEAAEIANAITKAYRDHHQEEWRQNTIKGIQVLEERLKEQEDKVESAETKVEELRRELNVPYDDTNYQRRVEYRPYWTAKRDLDSLIRFRDILKLKIESENMYLQSSKPASGALIDPAASSSSTDRVRISFDYLIYQPATAPSSPTNRKRRGTTTLVFGLAMIGFGLRLTVRAS